MVATMTSRDNSINSSPHPTPGKIGRSPFLQPKTLLDIHASTEAMLTEMLRQYPPPGGETMRAGKLLASELDRELRIRAGC